MTTVPSAFKSIEDGLQATGGLTFERIDPVPLPLGRDKDAAPDACCVPALDAWIFGDCPLEKSEAGFAPDSPCHTYAIIDANRVLGCVEMIEASDLEYVCLYDGDMAIELRDMAPWLVRLEPDNSFVPKLFSTTPEGSDPPAWLMWAKAPALYIRSRLDLADLRKHLRHFNRIELEDHGALFLRFWDCLCFEDAMTAYGEGGMVGLFEGINSFVIYHSRAALRMTYAQEVRRTPVKITRVHRDHYRDLRRARLAEAITEHFLTLPDFAGEDAMIMRNRVEKYLTQARRIGLREAADLHQLALGFALSHQDTVFQTSLREIYEDDARDMSQRRTDIMSRIATRIDAAKKAQEDDAI